MEFKNVNVELPEQHLEPHLNWLWVQTEKYGPMAAFYCNGKFMKNYACEVLDVIAWLPLPKYK